MEEAEKQAIIPYSIFSLPDPLSIKKAIGLDFFL